MEQQFFVKVLDASDTELASHSETLAVETTTYTPTPDVQLTVQLLDPGTGLPREGDVSPG